MTASPSLGALFGTSSADRAWSAPWIAGADPAKAGDIVVALVGHLASESANPAQAVRAAYAASGPDCITRLDGNFSVAIRDLRDGRVIVARDAAGTKPIYYSASEPFVFGSSAAEVLQASGKPAVANARAVLRYLEFGAAKGHPESLFEGIYELPGAHYLELRPGRSPEIRMLATPLQAAPRPARSLAESASGIRRLLVETVAAQAEGAKAGVALSGGVDSSGIVGGLRAALGPSVPIDAFFFASDLPDALDERQWAERAAADAQATLHPVNLQSAAIPRAMLRAFEQQDFPFGSPVALAQAAVLRAAADRGVQVMLGGHGADLLFGGSTAQIVVRASKMLRERRIAAAWTLLHRAAEYAAADPRRLFAAAIRRALLPGLPSVRRAREPWVRYSWFRERIAPTDERPAFESSDPMRRIILEHLYHATLPTSLQIEECNAMAHGIENRWPYLVSGMLEAASACRDEYLVSDDGVAKHVLREALRGLVPESILARPTRVGFAVPVLKWLAELEPWVNERLAELESLQFFRPGSTRGIRNRLSGNDMPAWRTAFRVWRWISLVEWAKAKRVQFE